MSLFCLLWIPLFYVLRRIFVPETVGGIWALPLGAAAVILQYFAGPLILPGDFGFSRWLSGFVDIIGLPVLIPLLLCFALMAAKVLSSGTDFVSFTLLWFIPMAVIRSMRWNSPPSLVLLVLVPFLWSSLAFGLPFFFNYIKKLPYWQVVIPSAIGMVVLPLAATTSWWAFFSHRPVLGFLFLAITAAPMAISIAADFMRIKPAVADTVNQVIDGNEQELM